MSRAALGRHRPALLGHARSPRLRVIGAVGVLVALLVVATATPGASAQDEPLLTRAEAIRVLRAYERTNASNNRALGVEGQGAIETPPIQLIDDATFRELRNRGDSLGPQGTVASRRVFVPRQTSYPLGFLAAERLRFSGGGASRQLLVFTRPTEADAWKVSTAAQLVDDAVPRVVEDRAGYAGPLDVDHAAGLKLTPDDVGPALVDVWSRSSEGEPATSELFEAGPLTTDAVSGLIGELGASGIDGEVGFAFEIAPYPVVSYRLERGRALVFLSISVHETITPNDPAGRLVQPRSRDVFGGLVVPGSYASVGYERLALLAAVIPRAASTARVRVIGSYTGLVSATAQP